MAVTPALATVIAGHTRTRERLENHVDELETLWKTLFSILESDISKVIGSGLEQAMTLLDKEKDNALRVITRSQRLVGDMLYDETSGPRQWTDGWRETATDRTTTLSERSAMFVNGGPGIDASPEETRHHGLSLVPAQEGDLGTSLRIVLEDMKMQMDRQTRAIELLAKENHQVCWYQLERRPAKKRSFSAEICDRACSSAACSDRFHLIFPEETIDPLKQSLYGASASDWPRLSRSANVCSSRVIARPDCYSAVPLVLRVSFSGVDFVVVRTV